MTFTKNITMANQGQYIGRLLRLLKLAYKSLIEIART